jgi:amino acid adenylation domain-containing protein
MPTIVANLFAQSAKTYPNRPSICIDSEVLTYAELAAAAGQISTCLQTSTVTGQNTCILLTRRTFAGFAGILGVLGAGKIYVPVSPSAPNERAISIASTTSPVAIIADYGGFNLAKLIAQNSTQPLVIILPEHELTEVDRGELAPHKVYDKSDLRQFPQEFEPVDVNPSSLAYILFTSGTTGEPKGVPVRQESVVRYVQSMASLYPLLQTDRCTQLFELTFDLSGHDMFVTWNAGSCLFVPHRGMALFSADLVVNQELTVWFSVPSVVSELMYSRKLTPGIFQSLRLAFFCGERMPIRLAQAMKIAAPNALIVNIYGPTEATIAFTHYAWDGKDLPEICHDLPIGYPLPEQQVLLLDSNRRPVPLNTVGEMYLVGSQVSDGYWKNSKQTIARYHDLTLNGQKPSHAYSTGDLAIELPDLGFVFRGRIDDQVKLNGVRIELGAIEVAVRRVSGNQQAAAMVWPQDYPTKLIVYVEKGDLSATDILEKCRNLLPRQEQPHEIVEIDRLPLTGNGKLDRKKLISLYQEQVEQVTNDCLVDQLPVPIAEDIESAVHAILSKQRSMDSISLPSFKPDEDLIEHTDSLGFINMIFEIEKKFAVTIKEWKAVTHLNKLVDEVMKARGISIGSQNKVGHNPSNGADDEPKIQRGLLNVILDYSSISSIDGKDGLLTYCGTPIDKLANQSYIDIAYKLFYDRYPTSDERVFALDQIRLGQGYEMQMAGLMEKIFITCPSPIKFILSVIPLFQQQSLHQKASQWSYALQLQGFVSAAICRHAALARGGEHKIRSTVEQSLPEWVLEGLSGRSPSAMEKQAFESVFVLLAECITNPGTFAARISTSTDADYISSVVAALAVFSGTKHGGATDDVTAMIKDIGSPSNATDWVKTRQREKCSVPGFGHRVFQVPDPRAPLLANWIKALIKDGADATPMKIITKVNTAMAPMRRHGTHVNVDAYTGVLLTTLGVPHGYGTLVFALARMAGWNAHVQEQKQNNIMINPLISYRPRQAQNDSNKI